MAARTPASRTCVPCWLRCSRTASSSTTVRGSTASAPPPSSRSSRARPMKWRTYRGSCAVRPDRQPAAPLGFACLVLAAVASAQERRAQLFGSDVQVRASYLWPENCHRGLVPVQLRFVNDGDRAHEVRVVGSSTFGSHELEMEETVVLAPHEARDVEWLVPLVPNPMRQVAIHLRTS